MFGLFSCCSPKAQDQQASAQAKRPEETSRRADTGKPVALEVALQPGAVAVVSIACCGMGSPDADAQALRAVNDGMQLAGIGAGANRGEAVLVSAMDAQRYAGNMPASADPAVRRLVQQITALYTQHGFAAFPIVLADRRVAFYGGVPSPEQFADRYRRLTADNGRTPLATATQ
jgi:hypothetical protein